MKKSVFSQCFVVLLLFSALVWWASVSVREAAAMGKSAPAGDPTAVDTIKQLEQDMGNAMVAGDIDKLNQIYADDWATVGSDGKTYNKESVVDDFKSGKEKLLSFENGPMDVQVFGNVAVAQGGVTEKRTRYGKDTSGEFVWNDLLKKRAGKWVVVRSSAARVQSGN
ncbi:MAG: nuclear transport factor 2 family protein [Candidatus Sulfotelmatobacter sp.]